MNITKNKISASLILILVLILLCTYINEISSMYKFGILVDDYKHIIASRPNYFALNSNINKYSWFTPVILPDSDVKIHVEHMVTANKTDINLIPEITDSNYLITIVECPYDKILSIDIENRINNQALSVVGSYLYARQPNNADKWKIEKISRLSQLNQKPEFKAAAVVFAVPPETKKQVIPIKRNWFKTAKQVLKIEYLNNNNQKQIIEYEFNLHWYQYMSGWDKIVSIT